MQNYEELDKLKDIKELIKQERHYVRLLSHYNKVKEDELLQVSTGTEKEPRMIKLSAKLETQFREGLFFLLK